MAHANGPSPRVQSGDEPILHVRAALDAAAPRVPADSAEGPAYMPVTAAAAIELHAAASAALEDLESHMTEDRALADRLFDGLLAEASAWDDSSYSDVTYDDIVKMPDALALEALASLLPSDLIAPASAVLRHLDPTHFDAHT